MHTVLARFIALTQLASSSSWASLARPCRLLQEVAVLPVARLHFDTRHHPDEVRATHQRFTSPHPRYRIFGHKQLGVALIDLRRLAPPASYPPQAAACYVKRARRRGYRLAPLERNDHIDAIHAINTSLASRQGRPMDARYQDRQSHFTALSHYRYFGMFDRHGKLVAYCNLGRYGNFSVLAQLLGYRNNDGVMHLMIAEVVALLLREAQSGDGPDYLMYDTFFGAQPGLRQFKTMLGFSPYRARYTLA